MISLFIHFLLTGAICLLSILDISLTCRVANELPNVKKNSKPEDYEMNPLVKLFWRKFGMKNTERVFLVVSPIIIISLLTAQYYFVSELYPYSIGFLIGSYFVINLNHKNSINVLDEAKEIKEESCASQ